MGKSPAVADANIATLKAGWNYCDTVELFPHAYRVPKATIAPGKYRKITGQRSHRDGPDDRSPPGGQGAVLRQLSDHAQPARCWKSWLRS
jgi:hypothetical protein